MVKKYGALKWLLGDFERSTGKVCALIPVTTRRARGCGRSFDALECASPEIVILKLMFLTKILLWIKAACECDVEHILSANGEECVRNPITLGDPCENSRQCAALDAKCRKASFSKSSYIKEHNNKNCLQNRFHHSIWKTKYVGVLLDKR